MPGRHLLVGLVQTSVIDDPDANLARTLELVRTALDRGARIVCLQELFRVPYFPRQRGIDVEAYLEAIPGSSTQAFAELAREYDAVIVVPIYELGGDGARYNTAVVVGPNGILEPNYRKVHIPHDPNFWEQDYFAPGPRFVVHDTPFCRLAVLICYDQWFPEAARAAALIGAELLLYPTAIGRVAGDGEPFEGDWQQAWETIQRSHAIANSVHLAAVNRVGTEGVLRFWGGSFVADAFGNVLARAGEDEDVLVVEIDLAMNARIREGWGFLANRRPDTYGVLQAGSGLASANPVPAIPAALGYRMPAEWEPHAACWLAWPHDPLTFSDLEGVEQCYTEIILALHRSERIELLVLDEQMERRVRTLLVDAGVDVDCVGFHPFDYADVWMRDYGPTVLLHRDGRRRLLVGWHFDAWGGKYEALAGDTVVPAFVRSVLGLPIVRPGITLEGGSIDVNGEGTVLVTEQCLLNQNRNPHLRRGAIEGYLRAYLGVWNIIWLGNGVVGDDTDGHIDDIARFVDERTVLCAVEENPQDENYPFLKDNLLRLQNARNQDDLPLRVVPLPMPGPVMLDGLRLPASYANFYIGNSTVIVPVFADPNDARALEIIASVFPDREVIGIDCRALVAGLGAIHCISQQEPSTCALRYDARE
jgi:agmatine deiminase